MSTTDPIRALCAELAGCLDDALTFTVQGDTERSMRQLVARARELLSQPPEPAEGPTDEELLKLATKCWDSYPEYVHNEKAVDRKPLSWDVYLSRAVLARYGTPRPAPIAVAERLPEPGVKVIAHYVNQLGKARTIMAEWVPAKTRIDESDETEYAEYDEERDCYYWPEGWYELVDNWDDCGAFKVYEGEVTHWQSLPKLPHDALPLPEVKP